MTKEPQQRTSDIEQAPRRISPRLVSLVLTAFCLLTRRVVPTRVLPRLALALPAAIVAAAALSTVASAQVNWSDPGAATQFYFPSLNTDRTFLTGAGEGPSTAALSAYHSDIRNTYVGRVPLKPTTATFMWSAQFGCQLQLLHQRPGCSTGLLSVDGDGDGGSDGQSDG